MAIQAMRKCLPSEEWMPTGNVLAAMTKETARNVSALMIAIGHDLNQSLRAVRAAEDAKTYERYLDVVSRVLTITLVEVMNPIYAEHPELKPKELG